MNSPIPRAKQPRFGEASPMRSTRDIDRPDRAWKKNQVTGLSLEALQRAIGKLQQDLGRLRRRVVGGGGGAATVAVDYGGQYDITKDYEAKTIVRFTTAGGAPGMYISILKVPVGIPPDTGDPYWDVFASSPPGVWG